MGVGDYERNMHVISGCYIMGHSHCANKMGVRIYSAVYFVVYSSFFAGGICMLFSFKQLQKSVVHKKFHGKE